MDHTITFTYAEDGSAVDPSSVVLADSASLWGVRSLTTQTIIVAANTAMNKVAVGSYDYDVTGLVEGEFYEFVVAFNVDGVLNHRQNVFQAGTAGQIPVVSRYASYAGMIRKFGEVSLRKWASVNGDNEPEFVTNVGNSAVYADEFIDSALSGGYYTVPFTTDPGIPVVIKDIADTLAGIHLYEAQGVIDFNPENQSSKHRFSRTKSQAKRMLSGIKTGRIRLFDGSQNLLSHAVDVPSVPEED